MRKLFIISIILFGSLHHTPAQNIDGVLYNIEQNNVSLRAQKSLGKAQRLEIRAGNMPEGPEVEYMHSWQKNSSETVSEINVTQGFDFPTQSSYYQRRTIGSRTKYLPSRPSTQSQVAVYRHHRPAARIRSTENTNRKYPSYGYIDG